MRTLVIVERSEDWPVQIPGVEVVLSKDYLTGPNWVEERGIRVFNLCRSYRYQSQGYYVSLLAVARRHRPFPDLGTVLDMKSRALVRAVDEELDDLIQKSLGEIRSERFELSVYFGHNTAKRHDRLARRLFDLFPAPLLRAQFRSGDRWKLSSVSTVAFRDVPDTHHEFLIAAASSYFDRPRFQARASRESRYDLAILHDPKEELAPSDPKALRAFRTAAEALGFGVEMIEKDDYGRLREFDALFIRETTAVNHHTFRFAQRAENEGLVVIDDPQSILRCTNKVFQTEAFRARGIGMPETWITDHLDSERVLETFGFPCVLKVPDSAFSKGVMRCADQAEFESKGRTILDDSDLLLVQEYLPSEFDWRVGIFDGEPLYACRYHMARGHWQIIRNQGNGKYRYGKVDTLPLHEVPRSVLSLAKKAASVIGDGLYGVDLKQIEDRVVVVEVNDNPNLDAGSEDSVLGPDLYRRIMQVFLNRVQRKKLAGGP